MSMSIPIPWDAVARVRNLRMAEEIDKEFLRASDIPSVANPGSAMPWDREGKLAPGVMGVMQCPRCLGEQLTYVRCAVCDGSGVVPSSTAWLKEIERQQRLGPRARRSIRRFWRAWRARRAGFSQGGIVPRTGLARERGAVARGVAVQQDTLTVARTLANEPPLSTGWFYQNTAPSWAVVDITLIPDPFTQRVSVNLYEDAESPSSPWARSYQFVSARLTTQVYARPGRWLGATLTEGTYEILPTAFQPLTNEPPITGSALQALPTPLASAPRTSGSRPILVDPE